MRTSPECLSCFARQTTYAAGQATDSQELRRKIKAEADRLIASFNLELSPPENAVFLYRMIAEIAARPDIFRDLKDLSNRVALAMRPGLAERISRSDDPFRTAALMAIAGNIIDYGSHHNFDVHRAVDGCLDKGLAIDDIDKLRADLPKAEKILYLGDNCGELAFDHLFISQLGRPVTFAVKESPVINDALRLDACEVGLDQICERIVSNTTDCPGTPLPGCSEEFQKIFREADLIISKGQGNFETLSETAGPIYFLLMVKCEVVAAHLTLSAGYPAGTLKNGDLILLKKSW